MNNPYAYIPPKYIGSRYITTPDGRAIERPSLTELREEREQARHEHPHP